MNDGGESQSSETLSAYLSEKEQGRALIVNGFDRISASENYRTDSLAGFFNDYDSGVPHLQDIAFIGEQRVFDLSQARNENDSKALGASHTDFETQVIGGNTFDYPYIHGEAIASAGYSFSSASRLSVESGDVSLKGYDVVDLILGKQRRVSLGRGVFGESFSTFTPQLQSVIVDYLTAGGALLSSGCYIGSDLWREKSATEHDRVFAREILGFELADSLHNHTTRLRTMRNDVNLTPMVFDFETGYRPDSYAIEQTDILLPASESSDVAIYYMDSSQPAAITQQSVGRSFTMGLPFEAIESPTRRNTLMRDILRFLNQD